MSKACPTCNSEFGKVSGICPTCNFDYAAATFVFGKSDTTITRCQSCGQEMRPADYVQRLRAELAAYQAKMPEAPKRYQSDRDGTMCEVGTGIELITDDAADDFVTSRDYDALAKRWAGMTARNERLTSEAKAFQMNYRLACDAETKRLTVELEAARKDAEKERLRACAMEHPKGPNDNRDNVELFLRDAYAAGCSAAQSRSLLTAMEYAKREAPRLRAVISALSAGKEKTE